MNRNAEAIVIFCSHLCVTEGINPLEPREWSDLAQRLMDQGLQPESLLDYGQTDFAAHLGFSEEEALRLVRLLDRSGSLRFELSKYEDMGIRVVTRADVSYPRQLKKKLGNACPPLFYCAGETKLLSRPSVGYVGSRTVEAADIAFTQKIVATTAGKGYAVVSGGAKGIDSVSAAAALSEGVAVIEYLSDSMMKKMRNADLMRDIREGRILLLSPVAPTAGFNVGIAMMRNRYIYAQSEGTVVVRSDKGKGGTWAGATDNLKKGWCPTFCQDCDYPGNRELIRLGAIGITEDWDGCVDVPISKPEIQPKTEKKTSTVQQLSLFD